MESFKTRPLLVCAARMNLILEGNRIQMRYPHSEPCRFGKVGDRLWLRETWKAEWAGGVLYVTYRSDGVLDIFYPPPGYVLPKARGWFPSRFMPRWMSRGMVEITDVRSELLQDISHTDARREGTTKKLYPEWWDKSTTNHGILWRENPLVDVISFIVVPQEEA